MMHMPLTQSLKVKGQLDRQEIFKQTDHQFHQKRAISHISSNCLTKTIANSSVVPERIPKAIEERQFFKSLVPRPFFSKNRKMAQLSKKGRNKSNGLKGNNSDACILPNDFTQILKAKSTVIKHKRLQEFYINREGRREQEVDGSVCPGENFKSNLFKPYFPKKSNKMRRNSFFLEKSFKVTDSLEVPAEFFKAYNRNTLSFAENPAIETFDYVLKEKETINVILNRMTMKKSNNFQQKENPRRRQRRRDKENMQFELQPWENIEPDESFF